MLVVYLDMLFMINFIIDYLLLSLTAFLRGVRVGTVRLLLSSALGAVMAVIYFFIPFGRIGSLAAEAVVCCIMSFSAFGFSGRRSFAGDCAMLCAVSFIFSGGIIAVSQLFPSAGLRGGAYTYFPISLKTLILGIGSSYFIIAIFFRKGSFKEKRSYKTVRCGLRGADIQFTAYEDTGNMVSDPLSGRSVIMVSPSIIVNALEGAEKALLSEMTNDNVSDIFRQLAEIRPHVYGLLPFKTAGGRVMTVTVRPDYIEIDGKRTDSFILGVSLEEIETVCGCRALIGC